MNAGVYELCDIVYTRVSERMRSGWCKNEVRAEVLGRGGGWGVGQSSKYMGVGRQELLEKICVRRIAKWNTQRFGLLLRQFCGQVAWGKSFCVGNFTPSDGSSINIYFQKEIPWCANLKLKPKDRKTLPRPPNTYNFISPSWPKPYAWLMDGLGVAAWGPVLARLQPK